MDIRRHPQSVVASVDKRFSCPTLINLRIIFATRKGDLTKPVRATTNYSDEDFTIGNWRLLSLQSAPLSLVNSVMIPNACFYRKGSLYA